MPLSSQTQSRPCNPGGYLAERWYLRWRSRISTAYPSASHAYWRTLPMKRLAKLFAGTFFAALGAGLAANLLLLNHSPWMHGLFWPIFCGIMAVSVSAARIKSSRNALAVWILFVTFGVLAYRATLRSAPLNIPATIYWRVVFDAVGIWLGSALSYRLLLSFITTEGLESVRIQTELSLALKIQATLVPDISFQNASFEVFGRSIPSTEMGGDIIDVVEKDGALLAYVADVSGHGIAAGQLMGMLKTAMRLSLQLQQSPRALLEAADRVLPAVKEAGMYATLALLRFDGTSEAEFASAGHVPILHYRRGCGDIVQLTMEQFPLGLIPGGDYESRRIPYSSGDVFIFFTDGISELENGRDEEFGVARLERLVLQYASQPLAWIWERIQQETRQFGAQVDDQTILLIRVLD